jgi:adenylylsulfate kinase-like enzyme
MNGPWCLLLTGLPNSGKSTIAYHMIQKRIRNALVIDGDKHREMQFLGRKLGFTKEDILINTTHVVKMAQFAQGQEMNVMIAQIAPYLEHRHYMRDNLKEFYEVRCICTDEERASRPNFKHSDLIYEDGNHDLIIDTGKYSVEQCVEIILKRWLGE